MESKFGVEVEVLERALHNMIRDGYMREGDTTEDLEDLAYTCCEGIGWYAKGKIYDWAND